MARVTTAPRRPLRRWRPLIAGVAAVTVVGTLAVIVDGYDAQEVPALSTSVWVTRDSGQYARVNTELAEIDTVRAADDPSVVQNGDAGLVFTQGLGRAWAIDAANPGDLGVAAADAAANAAGDGTPVASGEATPNGTREVQQAGPWVAYRTETGRSYLGTLPDADEVPPPMLVDPFRDVEVAEGEDPPSYVADAIAVDENGLVALYSAAESSVRLYDGMRDEFRAPVEVAGGPAADARLSMTLVASRWVLFDAEQSVLWLSGRAEPLDLGLTEAAVLQVSSTAPSRLHVADRNRLVAIDTSSGDAEELVADASGVPARPTVVAGDLFAAWVDTSSGLLYSESRGEVPLQVTAADLEDVDQPIPVIRSNGDRAVLNETASGMLWRLPDGVLIPVAQWNLDDENDRDQGTVQVDDVAEQKPPVAVADSFGVRDGDLVALPLLLNDHDPNSKDVLTIVPESITQIGPIATFGSLSLAANNQQAVVRVSASGGSASFSYSVTDGVSVSPPAAVTLIVVGGDANTAPEWCGVEACVQEWPSPGISAGGTVTVPVLAAWVDHEGDVIVLSDAVKDDPSAPVTVLATADGTVVMRHLDPNAGDAVIPITVTVADARGAIATRTLEVRVTANPALVAEPIAAVAGIGEKVSVNIAQHVRGGSGSFSIVDAVQTSAAGGLVVVPNAAAGQIDLTASAAGDYVVTYTVQDLETLAQQSAILRVTVVGAGMPLSMAPITAFVRANEDTTVDVLGAVQNTSGRVLIVSEATSRDANLRASVVGQSRVRVSGTTADGQPGHVGTATVTVTDGAGATVQGTVTVFLVPSSTVSGPIAVPDTATVRAGSQADILVLANDVSPRGERVVVHPALTASGTAGELAFVAGDRVRYLAPDVPGVYTLTYSIFLENAPELPDSASITVTVLPPGTNRDPQPPILTARVIAGQPVAIPFSGSGIDPDGDRVVLTDVQQPDSGQGSASISAEGDAIVYTAPGNGVRGGQVSFGYTVRDAQGAEAEGVVRVGVLAADISDVAPVTYGDYVRVQVGTPSPLTVSPLLNDRDPLQGALEIESVVPNVPAESTEYDRLLGLLDLAGLASGEVKVTAGTELGVHSYVYTVVSRGSFNNAEGLIVVNVTDVPSPDAPLVTDTVVTAENRALLSDSNSGGLDVVTGKVQWASGDPAGLELAIWGPAASEYTVDGWRISGPLPEGGDVVPFSLTGLTPSGAVAVSYGFLRIPAFDDMRIQLRAGTAAVKVPEEQTREFAVRALLDLDPNDEVDIRDDAAFTVQRANSSCALTGLDRVAYAAGREAPWTDTCTVPVRIAGQDTWTMLGVPIIVQPKDPQAILNSISRTIAPGGSEVVDLYDAMTTWEGARVGDIDLLDYAVSHAGSAFIVTETTDGTVQIDVRADARPGTRESVRISVATYGGLTAGITLVVGIAPLDTPRGANFTQVCKVSDGASCSIVTVDKPGEYDPFDGKVGAGLHLVGVGTGGAGAAGTVTCAVATARMGDDRTIIATWPSGAKPVGGECVVPYTVADAQGRTGQGQLRLDVQGYPQRPASVTTTAYTSSSVTLRVNLGDARNARPEVTGVVLYEGSSPVGTSSCSPAGVDYQCVVTGLLNGQDHNYTARAVNTIGESLDTTAHTTHSYQKPDITNLAVDSVFRPGVTAQNVGVVSLSITAADDAQSYQVLVDGSPLTTISRTGTTTTADLTLQPGTRQLQVIPISRFSPPISGTNEGDTESITGQPAGTPIVTSSGSAATAATSLTLTGVLSTANNSPNAVSMTYYAWKPTAGTPSCASTPTGDHQVTGAEQTSGTETISPLDPDEEYRVAACISYRFGAVGTTPIDTYTFQPPAAPAGPVTFTIDTATDGNGATRTYNIDAWDQPGAPPGYNLRYRIDGGALQNNLTVPEYAATIEGLFCKNLGGQQRCSLPTAYTPAAGSAPTSVVVQLPQNCSAAGSSADPSDVTTGSAAAPSMTVVASESNFGPFTTFVYDVTWAGAYASLDAIHYELDFC